MPQLNSAEIHLHGSTFSVVLSSPLAHLSAFQTLLELAVCAFASARDHPSSAARDSDSLQLASNELGAQVSHLHARAGEEVLTAVLYSWLWSCLRAERGYTEVYHSELNAYRTRSREGWPKKTLLQLAKTIRARREDVRALKDVATFAVEVLRILRSSNPPPSYVDTVAQHQDAPPTYTAVQSITSLQATGAQLQSASTSTLALTPSRAASTRQGPFQSSIVHKRESPARRCSIDEGSRATSPSTASRSSSPSNLYSIQEDESPDRSVRRRRQGPDGASLTAVAPSTPRSTRLVSDAVTTTTTTPPSASPSSPAPSAMLSSSSVGNAHADAGAEEKTEAQLSFERWLDAPRFPRVVPEWHFQPAEGEADWLTEMLV